MSFSASDVKKLREMTGAGMMTCKNALAETSGNIDSAVEFLRKKGLAAAQKNNRELLPKEQLQHLLKVRLELFLKLIVKQILFQKVKTFATF